MGSKWKTPVLRNGFSWFNLNSNIAIRFQLSSITFRFCLSSIKLISTSIIQLMFSFCFRFHYRSRFLSLMSPSFLFWAAFGSITTTELSFLQNRFLFFCCLMVQFMFVFCSCNFHLSAISISVKCFNFYSGLEAFLPLNFPI